MSPADDATPGRAPAVRASDADRERVAELLRRHAGQGRLDPDELDDRLTVAYGARTTAELQPLTVDLPALDADRPAVAPGSDEAARAELRAHVVQRAGGALGITLICVAIWLATGANGHPWPIWVALGTGLGVVGTSWRGLGPGGDPRAELERQRRKDGDGGHGRLGHGGEHR